MPAPAHKPSRAVVLPCTDPACPYCSRPFAVVQDGVLIIESRHGNTTHRNVISLARLIELAQATAPPPVSGAA